MVEITMLVSVFYTFEERIYLREKIRSPWNLEKQHWCWHAVRWATRHESHQGLVFPLNQVDQTLRWIQSTRFLCGSKLIKIELAPTHIWLAKPYIHHGGWLGDDWHNAYEHLKHFYLNITQRKLPITNRTMKTWLIGTQWIATANWLHYQDRKHASTPRKEKLDPFRRHKAKWGGSNDQD